MWDKTCACNCVCVCVCLCGWVCRWVCGWVWECGCVCEREREKYSLYHPDTKSSKEETETKNVPHLFSLLLLLLSLYFLLLVFSLIFFLLSSLPSLSSWALTATAASTSPVWRELVLMWHQCLPDQYLQIVCCC